MTAPWPDLGGVTITVHNAAATLEWCGPPDRAFLFLRLGRLGQGVTLILPGTREEAVANLGSLLEALEHIPPMPEIPEVVAQEEEVI